MRHSLKLIVVWLLTVASTAAARDVVRLPVPYIQQPDGNTCLPTSLCMAMHFMGRCDLTTETIYTLHKTCRFDRYNLPGLVAQFGLYAFPSWLEHAWTRETVEAELRAGRPVILGLDCSRAGHFVLAVGYTDDGRVIIHDPYWKETGWDFGGPYVTTDWAPLIWRNGIILRGEPFPQAPRDISATLVATTAPRTMIAGTQALAEFAVRNNGRAPWPKGVVLAAVDAYATRTAERQSPLAVLSGDPSTSSAFGTWLSASRVCAPKPTTSSLDVIAPGEVAYFRVPLRAPATLPEKKPVTLRENFNLLAPDGKWFSDHFQTGPSNRQIHFRVAVVPPPPDKVDLPMVETVANGKPMLPWRVKNGGLENLTVATHAPALTFPDPATSQPLPALELPQGPALRLLPPIGTNFQTAFTGDPLGTDYRVEAWMYCDIRPQDAARGFDRVGLFMRDSGQHRLTSKTETENGDAIVLSIDGDDGRVRAGDFSDGGAGEMLRGVGRIRVKSGWHQLAIRCEGTTVTFELDGLVLGSPQPVRPAGNEYGSQVVDFARGDCGVFVYSTFPDDADRRRGVTFAGFRIDP